MSHTDAAESLYARAVHALNRHKLEYMVGGAYAMREYAAIVRDTKDFDLFCRPGDYTALLQVLAEEGFEPSITDANWLAKARHGDHVVDLIFNSANGLSPVDDVWFEHARRCSVFRHQVLLIPPEELLATKAFVQDRYRFDGADVLHLIRARGAEMNWQRLLQRMDLQWEILLQHIVAFRFVYPSERDSVPTWLLRELINRVEQQMTLPAPEERICRGPLLSRTQYEVDITEWGYQWGYKQA